MRKLSALLVLAAALSLAPQAAMAQAARPPAPLMPPAQAQAPAPLMPQVQAEIQAQAQKVGDVFGLTANQVVAIGIGIVGGVVVAEAINVAVGLGAVAGGVIGNWWYMENADEGLAGSVKK